MSTPNKNTTSTFNLLDIDHDTLFAGKKKVNSPKDILDIIGISPGETVVDFGCGIGYFILEVAERVGENGRVVAVDIDRAMLDAVKDKAVASGFRNIYGVQADLQIPGATKVADQSADLVIIINLLYYVKKREEALREAFRILKTGGKMAIMEWSEKGTVQAMEKGLYISTSELKDLATKLGFKFFRSLVASVSHEISIFEKE